MEGEGTGLSEKDLRGIEAGSEKEVRGKAERAPRVENEGKDVARFSEEQRKLLIEERRFEIGELTDQTAAELVEDIRARGIPVNWSEDLSDQDKEILGQDSFSPAEFALVPSRQGHTRIASYLYPGQAEEAYKKEVKKVEETIPDATGIEPSLSAILGIIVEDLDNPDSTPFLPIPSYSIDGSYVARHRTSTKTESGARIVVERYLDDIKGSDNDYNIPGPQGKPRIEIAPQDEKPPLETLITQNHLPVVPKQAAALKS